MNKEILRPVETEYSLLCSQLHTNGAFSQPD